MHLRALLDEGYSVRAAARRIGVPRSTVRAWIARDWLDVDVAELRARTRPRSRTDVMLDAYTPLVARWLMEYPRGATAQLLVLAREAGYTGSDRQLRALTARVRTSLEQPIRVSVAPPRSLPGRRALVELAIVGPAERRSVLLGAVLPYSGLLWAQVIARVAPSDIAMGLATCFAAWGGTPRELVFDLPCAAPLARDGGRADDREGYAGVRALLSHHDISLRHADRLYPTGAGAVERFFRTLRDAWPDDDARFGVADPNASLTHLTTAANARVRADTRRSAAEEFERAERPALRPLPAAGQGTPDTRRRRPSPPAE